MYIHCIRIRHPDCSKNPHLIKRFYLNFNHPICFRISFNDTFLAVLARCLGDICLVQNMGGAARKVWSNEKRMQSMMQMARIYMMVIKIHDCEEILKQKNSTQNNVFLSGRLKARKGKMRARQGARFPIFFFPSEASLNNSECTNFKSSGNSFAPTCLYHL